MTNGEKMCIDFPNMRYTISELSVVADFGLNYWNAIFDLDWWDAEYKEPTNNKLGVDCISNPNNLPSVTQRQKYYEDIAKAFQMGLLFGFGEKQDDMDRIVDEIKKGCHTAQAEREDKE